MGVNRTAQGVADDEKPFRPTAAPSTLVCSPRADVMPLRQPDDAVSVCSMRYEGYNIPGHPRTDDGKDPCIRRSARHPPTNRHRNVRARRASGRT
jgi:hypothetical protein